MDLSLIIPSYNSSDFIISSIKILSSYLLTLDCEYEIIIVDDGSNDSSPDMLRELNLTNLKIVELGVNKGKFNALKEGFRLATGKVQIRKLGHLFFQV